MKTLCSALVAFVLVSCATSSPPPSSADPATSTAPVAATPAPSPSAAPTPPPAPLADILSSVLWMQTAAEYRANAQQAYNVARMRLDQALADPRWTAALEQTGAFASLPPAVILDADETAIDNSPFEARLLHRRQRYTEELWEEWVNEARATAIPGAKDFLDYATSRGVEVFFVTNRQSTGEEATRRNLQSLGFPLNPTVDTVLTRGENNWTSGDKSPRRALVAQKYRVLLLLGDDFGDFVTIDGKTREERQALVDANRHRWGRDWIILPNAMYGSWERAVVGNAKTERERVKAKFDALRVD